ncbi:hypothetical protein Dimus_021652 [Dionaea muscipula]
MYRISTTARYGISPDKSGEATQTTTQASLPVLTVVSHVTFSLITSNPVTCTRWARQTGSEVTARDPSPILKSLYGCPLPKSVACSPLPVVRTVTLLGLPLGGPSHWVSE